MRRVVLLAVALVALASCTSTSNSTTSQPMSTPSGTSQTTSATGKAFFGAHGFDLTGMDTTVNACDDFYSYAVGNWRKANPLDKSHSRFGRFEQVADRNRDLLRAIVEQDANNLANEAPGSPEQKIGAFYSSCMNETAIDAAGLSPIQPELDRINAITDRASLLDELAHLHQQGYAPLFRIGGTNDFKNSKMIIAAMGPGSLGLPDRDYYLTQTDRFSTIRGQYIDHVAKILALAGEPDQAARSDAQRILDMETKLATATLPRIEQRDPNNVYHITSTADLAQMAPNINWNTEFQTLGVNQPTLNVSQPKYVQSVNQLISDVPIEDWKTYLKWQVLDAAAPTLPKAFAEEDFNFNSRVLSGQQEQRPRWERCIRATDANLGQLLGQEYVKRNFTPEAKAKMNALIDNLVSALREDIPTLSWMGPQTKEAALAKLAAFRRRIGYPDKWIDYSALNINNSGTYFANMRAARQFAYRRNLNRIGGPDDPNEWGFFTPPTVNASYSPSQNNITFPAGILQPPFYDPNADDAYNYGGIGTVIGHEMTHGFDDQGARFDAEGNLRNWWTPEDLKNFQARANCIVNEYGEFEVAPASNGQPAINIRGALVQGEAIADLGGATLALRAYEKSLQGKQRQTIDGFTPEQRFFLGFAQVWGENMAAAEQTRRALTDPHAQGPFRVNGTVQNMPEFAKAFHCGNGSHMVREEAKRCSIW